MSNTELNQLIDWRRRKMREKNRDRFFSGKRKEGYREAMLCVMSYLHSLKEEEN